LPPMEVAFLFLAGVAGIAALLILLRKRKT
jgi:LPXTG-motif cell wall-anchored protein